MQLTETKGSSLQSILNWGPPCFQQQLRLLFQITLPAFPFLLRLLHQCPIQALPAYFFRSENETTASGNAHLAGLQSTSLTGIIQIGSNIILNCTNLPPTHVAEHSLVDSWWFRTTTIGSLNLYPNCFTSLPRTWLFLP